MRKVITWSTSEFQDTQIDTNCLFYAENLIRHFRYYTPFNLKYCIAGEMRGYFNNQYRSLKPGQFIIVNAGTDLNCQPAEVGTKAIHAFFTNQLVEEVAYVLQNKDGALLDAPEVKATTVHFFQDPCRDPQLIPTRMKAIAEQLSAAELSRQDLQPDIFYSLVESMFSNQADISRQINRLNARSGSTREELFRRVLKGKEFMCDSWQSDLNLSTVARQACLSPYHFHRIFLAAFGQPPMRWLRQFKLQKARAILASGQMSISQVALHCGFADVFTFSKAFKRVWGETPSSVFKP